ncbi:hypothetical protein D5F01_LYC11221 [Larimichthys crocea]|uniref:Tyr recombinase domain-containing protein n=1 Tax=Larimichthys crocea TaxID=215358 RepID=A0A6G0IDE6_LARCR|nr:hypothetical protein D5F01_LYC11221 [Larimichthys crocea]
MPIESINSNSWLQTPTLFQLQSHRIQPLSSADSAAGTPGRHVARLHPQQRHSTNPLLIPGIALKLSTHQITSHSLRFSNFITFIKSSTIQVYLSGINFLAKLSSGSPCTALTHAHINMLLKGLLKAEPCPMPKRLPLTSDLLAHCIETLSKGYLSPSTDKVLESMFLLAFFGFLRCSEFTASTLLYDQSRHASLSDVFVLSSDTLIYFLKRSKTQPVYLFRLNSLLSPYEPILDYTNSRLACQASPRDPLFISETSRVATRSWFHHHFRQILLRSSIPPELYSGHSFRIRASSTSPDNITKILGRWSSTA